MAGGEHTCGIGDAGGEALTGRDGMDWEIGNAAGEVVRGEETSSGLGLFFAVAGGVDCCFNGGDATGSDNVTGTFKGGEAILAFGTVAGSES